MRLLSQLCVTSRTQKNVSDPTCNHPCEGQHGSTEEFARGGVAGQLQQRWFSGDASLDWHRRLCVQPGSVPVPGGYPSQPCCAQHLARRDMVGMSMYIKKNIYISTLPLISLYRESIDIRESYIYNIYLYILAYIP